MGIRTSIAAENRKARSEAVLNKLKIRINENLPCIEDESEALVRDIGSVANRAIALIIVALKAEGLEQEIVERLVKDYDMKEFLSPNEADFIADLSPSQHDESQFTWRYEAAWVLLWALGYVKELSHPSEECDVPGAVTFLQERSAEQFIADSKLRPITEILDQADLIYRYHWAVVDARINGKPCPSEIDPNVALERHYALNWIIGYMDDEWDDISTDT